MGSSINRVDIAEQAALRPRMTARLRHGRAVNAVASFLRGHLRVPNVYLEPGSAVWEHVDVLAADGAGSGDIHAVEVKLLKAPVSVATVRKLIHEAKQLSGHYRYLAVDQSSVAITMLDTDIAFSADGIGRIGLLLLSELEGGTPRADLAVKPERFRLSPAETLRVERFLDRTKPDMFVRI